MDDNDVVGQLGALHPDSFGWALACCRRERTEAEDVLQMVYLQVLDGRARFDGRSSFKTWLFSVIRRTAAGERRRRLMRRVLLERHWSSAIETRSEPDSGAGVEQSET